MADVSQLSGKLPGNFFDITPQNIIITPANQPVVIDTEWSMESDIELGFLLFRSLLLGTGSYVLARIGTGAIFSRRTFIESALSAAGYSPTSEDILRFVKLESVIQQQVTGCSSPELLNWWLEQPLPTSNQTIAKRNEQTGPLDHVIGERNEQIGRLNEVIAEREERIATLRQQIIDIRASTSWRLTGPIRSIKSALMDFGQHFKGGNAAGFTRSIWFNNLMRGVYKRLPLPWHAKQRLKEIYLRRPKRLENNNKDVFQLGRNR